MRWCKCEEGRQQGAPLAYVSGCTALELRPGTIQCIELKVDKHVNGTFPVPLIPPDVSTLRPKAQHFTVNVNMKAPQS